MELKKPIKERANKIFVKFKIPLTPQSLNSLSIDSTFTGKFSTVDIIKYNENVIGIHVIDKSNIDFLLNIEGIESFSMFQKDDIVKKELKSFTEEIFHKLGRDIKDFIINDHIRHEIIKIDLRTLINPKLIKNLKEILNKKGYDDLEIISIKFLAKQKGEIKNNIMFHYPSPKNQEQERLVVEANDELIENIIKILK